jgi:hypothetical protein
MTDHLTLPMRSIPHAEDPRLAAFRSPAAQEIFHSVCQKDQVWRRDLFDVHAIHEEARDAFYVILERAISPAGTPYGHLLLLLGEAGSGKTHLMRAFRNHAHGNRVGYCGYLQMTTATENYGRYVLVNLIESLDDPYFEGEVDRSGLMSLSDALVESAGILQSEEMERLRNAELSAEELAHLTVELADRFIIEPRFEKLDAELIRALFCLQRDDARIRSRVLKFLRCENLNEFDRAFLPGLTPRLHDHHPQEMVEHLGQLLWTVQHRSLILLIDQLEDMANFDADPQAAEVRFRRTVQTLCALAGAVPSSVFVISCLEDFYHLLRNVLTGSARDRLEQDPPPVRLTATRTAEEVEKIVEYRLGALYDAGGVANADPTFPFPPEFLGRLAGLRTRDVLDRCRRFRNEFIAVPERAEPLRLSAGTADIPIQPPAPAVADVRESTIEEQIGALRLAWNDFRAGFEPTIPESEEEQAALLGKVVEFSRADLPVECDLQIAVAGNSLTIHTHPGTHADLKLLIGVCNRPSRGGAFARQIDEFITRATGTPALILRSTDFPSDGKTKAGKLLDAFLASGGRRTVVEDSHWRQMQAFEKFHELHAGDPGYDAWRKSDRPLTNLKPILDILPVEKLIGQEELSATPEILAGIGAANAATSLADAA